MTSVIVEEQYETTPAEVLARWLAGEQEVVKNERMTFEKFDLAVRVDDRAIFPLKSHKGAETKVNLFFSDVWKVLDGDVIISPHNDTDTANTLTFINKIYGKLTQKIFQAYHPPGLSNDAATGWLIWSAHALTHIGASNVIPILQRACDRNALKRLTSLVKTAGIAGDIALATLAETESLSGRMVGSVDVDDEYRTRCTEEGAAEKGASTDPSKLRAAVRAVLREHITGKLDYEDVDRYWSKRWAFTKAGGHSSSSEEKVLGARLLKKGERHTRREFAEAREKNVLLASEPAIYAGMSEKLEHGKTRAIYGSDTVSYYHFDYVLRSVERAWEGKHVILDPGRVVDSSFYKRLAKQGKVAHTMLDYDDFNSQHSVETQKMVFEELEELVRERNSGADLRVFKWVRESFDNMWVHFGDGTYHRAISGMFSGLRATSFLNSVLNRAYLMTIINLDKALLSYHIGDDVYLSYGTVEQAAEETRSLLASGQLRMNATKQSYGYKGGDFLRIFFGDKACCGLVARSIASLVSGSWASENVLGSQEYISSMLQNAWTLMMRSRNTAMPMLLVSTFKRRVPSLSAHAEKLLTFRESYAGGPLLGAIRSAKVVRPRSWVELERGDKDKNRPAYATQAYIDGVVDHRLLEAIDFGVGRLRSVMLEASYPPTSTGLSHIAIASVDSTEFRSTVDETHYVKRTKGRLENILPLAFLRDRISDSQLAKLCLLLGGRAGQELHNWAWGMRGVCVSVCTPMSYSEAQAWMYKAVVPSNVLTSYPAYA